MERWWPLRFPQRLLLAAEIALLPLKVASLLAETVLAAAVLGAAAAAWSIHTGAIPQTEVEGLLTSAGAWALGVLHRQGVY